MRLVALALVIICTEASAEDSPLASQPMMAPALLPASNIDPYPAKRDLGDVFRAILGDKKATPPPPTNAPIPFAVSVLPNVYASPAVGLAIGVALAAGFRAGPAHTTSTSSMFATAVFTTEGQFMATAKHFVFTPRNEWILSGDYRYLDMAQNTYGLGTATPIENKAPMEYRQLRLHQRVYRKLTGALYFGIGYEVDHHYDIIDHPSESGVTPRQAYEGHLATTTSSGITSQFLLDSRDSAIRPTKGAYAEGGFHAYPQALGSTESWQMFHGELRLYVKPWGSPRHILGIWGGVWASLSKGPYLDLPALAWDINARTGRGYVQGRYRGQSELYGEVEYRLGLTNDGLIGAVFFMNISAFSTPPNNTFDGIAPAFGLGLRMMMIKATSTNLGIDFAYGRLSTGVYFVASETF